MKQLDKFTWLKLIILTILTLHPKQSFSLEFDNTTLTYNNLLVAIDPGVPSTQCTSIITNVQEILTQTSHQLEAITGASLGTVNILIPPNWPSFCGSSMRPKATDSYDFADIKLTNQQPQAEFMTWTRQYKQCGLGADDIFIPVDSFLLSTNLDVVVKSKILLHEWMKFRYGVYEEYGYFGDSIFDACYSSNQKVYFTSCVNNEDLLLSDTTTGESCESLILLHEERLISSVMNSSSSLMSVPNFSNVAEICYNQTHNTMAVSKQNVFCNGKGILEVLTTAPNSDFYGSDLPIAPPQGRSPTFTLIKHSFNSLQMGYAFVIENSDNIRLQDRLRYIKQAIVKMVDLLPSESMGFRMAFTGGVTNPAFEYLSTDSSKALFLNGVPDIDTPTLGQLVASKKLLKDAAGRNNDIATILQKAIDELKRNSIMYKWHIYFITSSPSVSLQDAIPHLRDSEFTITVATFEENSEWMSFYQSQQTKNVLALPNCTNAEACATFSNMLLDDFVQTMGDQFVPRNLQKVVEKSFTASSTIDLPNIPDVMTFWVYVTSMEQDLLQITLQSPSGSLCDITNTLEYTFVGKLNTSIPGCEYQPGTWKVNFPTATPSLTTLTCFVQTPSNTIKATASLGEPNGSLSPNNKLVPIYTRATDGSNKPLLSATVEYQLYSQTGETFSTTPLLDNGNGADIMANDGIYSGFIEAFSSTPTLHSGRVNVVTSANNSKILTSVNFNESKAAFLNMTTSESRNKCCGSSVPISTALDVPISMITATIPGFFTKEAFDQSTLPPSKILNVVLAEDTPTHISLRYTAPGIPGSQTVQGYEACCLTEEVTSRSRQLLPCTGISSPSDCAPVIQGETQTCRIHKRILLDTFGSESQDETKLVCYVRAVSSYNVPGEHSGTTFETTLIRSTVNGQQCESLSDDCLPITIFWVLIGCLAGLLLIIIILIVCCYMQMRKKQPKPEPNRKVHIQPVDNVVREPTRKLSLPDKDSPLYNVYVNKAYIQDADGQMKLVASDGELLPIHDNHIEHGTPTAQVPPVRQQSATSPISPLDDTIVYKTIKPNPPPKPKMGMGTSTTTFKPPVPTAAKPDLVRSNAVDYPQVPVVKSRTPKLGSTEYVNSNSKPNNVHPMYATVGRSARKPPNTTGSYQVNPYGHSPATAIASIMNNNERGRVVTPTAQNGNFQNQEVSENRLPRHFGTSSTTPRHNPVARQPVKGISSTLPRHYRAASTTPSRLDAFPSSDSDTYSDMSRGIPIKSTPPHPPPFPKELANANSNRNFSQKYYPSNKGYSDKSRPKAPPSYAPPPIPPTSYPVHKHGNNSQSEDYDDDSEHWDDEDFDFNPGTSYA